MERGLACVLVVCLVGEAFGVPLEARRRRGYSDNELDSEENRGDAALPPFENSSKVPINPAVTLPPVTNNYEEKRKEYQTQDSFDDDVDDFEPMQAEPTRGGGSNILSLLNLASGLFPGSSGASAMLRRMMRELIRLNPQPYPPYPSLPLVRRKDIGDNEIDIDYTFDLKPPPFKREESEENESESESQGSESEEDNAAEESVEDNGKEEIDDEKGGENNNASQQNSAAKADDNDNGGDSNDSDYDDEPPGGGDGQGGGVLGILAGLSGDDGQSDLGSLLATVSGIVVSLSGDGFDLNSLIASALGLFVGLLSEGEENPGTIIASYLLTSLETITGGGSKNNGAFFGKLLSKLISGTSMGEAPEGSSDESGEPQGMKDSAGFLLSLLMGLSGEMSKTSSAGSSKPW